MTRLHSLKPAFLELLKAHGGVISHAANDVGITTPTVYRWMSEDAEFNASVEQIRNRVPVMEFTISPPDFEDFNIIIKHKNPEAVVRELVRGRFAGSRIERAQK